MSTNPHAETIQADPALNALVDLCGPRLQQLNRNQVEKLVFYLKAIHDYYPRSENHVAFWTDFSKRLDEIKNSEEQRTLQRSAALKVVLGILACLAAGAVSAPVLSPVIAGLSAAGTLPLLMFAIALVVAADIYGFRRAILLSKEQDRRYFLASIRSARACNELDWAGLFAYSKSTILGPQSDADIARAEEATAAISDSLRVALYNDEFFQYSNKNLSRFGPGDA